MRRLLTLAILIGILGCDDTDPKHVEVAASRHFEGQPEPAIGHLEDRQGHKITESPDTVASIGLTEKDLGLLHTTVKDAVEQVVNGLPNSNHGPASAPLSDSAITIIEEAKLRAGEDNERATLLEEMAFARMRSAPSEVPAVWQLVKARLDELKDKPTVVAGNLDAFMTEVRGALSECQTISEFSSVWKVYEEIQAHLQEINNAIYDLAAIELSQAVDGIDAANATFPDGLALLNSISDANGQALSFVLSSSLAENDAETSATLGESVSGDKLKKFTDAVRALVGDVLGKGESLVAAEREKLTKAVEEDRRGVSKDPAAPNDLGFYQQEIEAVQNLQAELGATDLTLWSLVARENFSLRIESIGIQLDKLSWEATSAQKLRYNTWALRQIRSTESAQSWPDYLGMIDLQLLDPSVSSLYSMTYDGLIKNESDPTHRDRRVRALLAKAKVRLEQF